MKTIASHTLGCKVNQYDTQAMLELFQKEGYECVPLSSTADVYLINTCTVTGAGDKKSFQLIRRLRRSYPGSLLIVCGCLAQKLGEELLRTGADLVIGTQRRGDVVRLLDQVVLTGKPLCAVSPLAEDQPFERLSISDQTERMRAVLKIQEGCSNHCSYCIIPSVRGPVRSRPPEDIAAEVERLSDAGFREIVLTGIHLCSYGRDLSPSVSLLDIIRLVQQQEGILRIRLGSLEPTVATPDFASALIQCSKLCPQFHLALQSGSDSVLARMRRRYNTAQFLQGMENLRRVFPHAAFTTDILTGFPGETEEEYRQTCEFIRKAGFARIHVFPYSPRPDTPAASFPNQLPTGRKEKQCRELIALGREVARQYMDSWIGLETVVLPERIENGLWEGYSPEYVRVSFKNSRNCEANRPVLVRLTEADSRGMRGEIIE